MALTLPRIVVDLSGTAPRAKARRGDILRAGELTRLLALDRVGRGAAVSERCLALPDRRWVVGRRIGDVAVWRVVDEEALRRIGHPAWLWTRDLWFDPALPEDDAGATPPLLPLRHQIQAASSLGGNRKRTIKALASTIARLRDPDRTAPVAVLAPPQAIGSASFPARWFVLSLLTCLPPEVREGLRVGWGDDAPDPSGFDVVVCAGWHRGPRIVGPEGFDAIDAVEPPGEGDDLVAYYVRNRLHANDTEAVEAAAYLEGQVTGRDPSGCDRWGAGVAALLRDGVPGVSVIDDTMLERDPEGAVRALSARLRAGAPLDQALLNQLVEVTRRTRDARPWAGLANRAAVERARAVQALLEHAPRLRPRSALVQVLGALYPPGAAIEPWIEALMRWVEAGSQAAVTVLENTLLDWPASRTRATRASIWSEVVRALVKSGRYDAAMAAVVAPLSRELAREGAARAVVGNWSAVPVEVRSPERLAELVDILAEAKDGGPAVAMLFRYVRESPAEVRVLVRRWTERRSPGEDDPLLEAIRSVNHLGEWVAVLADQGAPAELGETVARWAQGPDDPIWREAEEAQAAVFGDDPRDRFVALHNLGAGLHALEPRARELVAPAIAATRYPDFELAETARALVEVPGASPIWRWVAITATVPDHFDDATVDATTVAFCQDPPDRPLVEAALASARALGRADRWEVLDHARWIVRLCLAPDDGTGLHLALATALAQGIALRRDAVDRMVAITDMLLDLEPDHPALLAFVRHLLPNAWLGGLPRLYVDRIPPHRLPPPLVDAWQALVR